MFVALSFLLLSQQMCGRAGRKGKQDSGESYLIVTPPNSASSSSSMQTEENEAWNLVQRELKPLRSCLDRGLSFYVA